MDYSYGTSMVNGPQMTQDPMQMQQMKSAFVPQQSLFTNPNPSAYAPKAPAIQASPLSKMQNGYGGFMPSTFESLPDAVKQNIMQGASGLGGSGMYNAYLRQATQGYNGFENQYGVGQVPWALQQQNYNGLLFNPFNQGPAPSYYQNWGNRANGGSYKYDPYSGSLIGKDSWQTGGTAPQRIPADNFLYGQLPSQPSRVPYIGDQR